MNAVVYNDTRVDGPSTRVSLSALHDSDFQHVPSSTLPMFTGARQTDTAVLTGHVYKHP